MKKSGVILSTNENNTTVDYGWFNFTNLRSVSEASIEKVQSS